MRRFRVPSVLLIVMSMLVFVAPNSFGRSPASVGGSALLAPTFTEKYRPAYHFTPAKNWMNDPNGLVYHNGEYHLFYQYNPEDYVWGHMSWGHAVSRDLKTWTELPVAIPEDEHWMYFSGSAVIDKDNTSGFGKPGNPAMVAIFTMAAREGGKQAQGIAYSLDNGRTFTKYSANPVLDINSTEFRDPKVQWYEPTKSWLMTVSNSTDHTVSFYTSKNLKSWKLLSKFGPTGAIGGVWECPDLFQLPVDGNAAKKKWVLVVNINPGGVAGGSAAQYFLGDFDGTTFTADFPTSAAVTGADWVDHGADYYAAVSWDNTPTNDRVMIGWMNNWTYAQKTPTSPWRSATSVPRTMGLKTINGEVRLVQTPIVDASGKKSVRSGGRVSGVHSLGRTPTGAYQLDVSFDKTRARNYGVQVRTGRGQTTVVGYDARSQQVYLDRTRSGESAFAANEVTGGNDFRGVHRAAYRPADGKVKLRILVDEASVEVFAGDGEAVLTDQIFPEPGSLGLSVFSHGGATRVISPTVTTIPNYRS